MPAAFASLDALSTPVVVASADGTITHLSPAMAGLLVRRPALRPGHANPVGTRLVEAWPTCGFERLDDADGRQELVFEAEHVQIDIVASPWESEEGPSWLIEWHDATSRQVFGAEVEELVFGLANGELDQRGNLEGQDEAFQPVLAYINFLVDTLAGPIRATRGALSALAQGLPAEPVDDDYPGEFGALVSDLNGLVAVTARISAMAEQVACGDLTVELRPRSEDDQLLGALRRMVDNLSGLLRSMQRAAGELDLGGGQILEASDALAQEASRSAASLQQITVTVEQVSAQTKDNAMNAASALELAQRARAAAQGGDARMTRMMDAMRSIAASSFEVSKTIKVIDDIAFQTNLLALNAAVEAGRAGENGRGFAVVAEEVRRLAARSAEAAKETATMMESSTQSVSEGISVAETTAQSLHDIVRAVSQASDLVAEIAAASQEQAQSIDEINHALGQVDSVTQHNTAKAEELAAASRDLASQVDILKGQVSGFQLKPEPRSTPQPVTPEMLQVLQRMLAERQ